MILKVTSLYVSYGMIDAVRGIDFEVNEGEIVTLIGSNGAGKTSTLRAISGLEKKKSGQVIFMDEDITNIPAHKIAKKGLIQVPEGRRIFPKMTVTENLEMGALIRAKDIKGIKSSLESVFVTFPRLLERKEQLAGTLSGGEQQMLAVARAMMSGGKIILLDEPSMGLAPMMVNEIFRIIESLHSMGITILLVEQNANKSLNIADRAYVLEHGKITITGSGRELLTNPKVMEAYLGV